MALQGSLETVELPDVLSLLGRAAKSGRLDVTGAERSGGVWFVDGRVTAAPPEDSTVVDIVDALFALLRIDKGTFCFDGGAPPPGAPSPVDLTESLAAARTRLSEWREIEAVV